LQNISLFLRVNFLITALIYAAFILFNRYESLSVFIFSISAAISTVATLYLIIYLLFRPFFLFAKTIRVVLAILFFLINFALVADLLIYKVWKFHINSMVVNIITSPSAWDSLHVSIGNILMVVATVLFFLVGEYLLLKMVEKIPLKRTKHLNSRFNRIVVPFLVLLIIAEKIYFGMADVYNKRAVLEAVKPIPLYQPLTFVRFVQKHFGIKPVKKQINKNSIDTNSKVRYPLSPIVIDKNLNTPNIFIFMFDALRASIISEDVAPNITALKKDSFVFTNHISGGDATRFGIFSFFYGLNATYWFNFLHAQREPVLFEVLKKRGYQIKIISSTSTKWPEFRQSVYCGVSECISDTYEGAPCEKDAKSAKSFIDWIEKADSKKPIFTFVFLDAPHGYSYPKEFDKFKPNAGGDGINYITASRKNRQKLLNTYKNAIFYDDHLLGEMIDAIKKKGLYKRSVLIFSSDHGEEFYEYGFFGHNSSFSMAQINSPLIFKLPQNRHDKIEKMTSHMDIPATLMKILGVKNPPYDYSFGSDILDKDFNRSYAYIAKWNKNAILTKNYIYIYSNLPNEIFSSQIRERKTYKIVKSSKENIEKILIEVLEQNRRFLQ